MEENKGRQTRAELPCPLNSRTTDASYKDCLTDEMNYFTSQQNNDRLLRLLLIVFSNKRKKQLFFMI